MSDPVLIIGAGLAGLSCGRELQRQGVSSVLLEHGDDIGGRVRTDFHDGFRLDRGFQVLLTAYPEAARQLDYADLNLKMFEPGSLIWSDNRLHRLTDPWRKPSQLLGTATSRIGSFKDKLLIGLLRWRANRGSIEDIFTGRDVATEQELRRLGFSDRMVEQFLRPFLGGVFLDCQLQTSARMLYFVFRMFSQGDTALPSLGMGEIPRQLASELPSDSIRLNSPVELIGQHHVRMRSGNRVPFSRLVVATEQTAASQLIPELGEPKRPRSVTCVYFSAPEPPLEERMLVLNGSGAGLVNNLCVPSEICSDYSSDGHALISVTVLKEFSDTDALPTAVKEELTGWFGNSVQQWKHLRTYRISNALPNRSPVALGSSQNKVKLPKHLFVCGDHQTNGSINGAFESGLHAAKSVLATL